MSGRMRPTVMLLALGITIPGALVWSLGCGRASEAGGRRPANAGVLLVSRSSLQGALKPVG